MGTHGRLEGDAQRSPHTVLVEGALFNPALVAQEARVLGKVEVSLRPEAGKGRAAQLGVSG
eukprot:11989537-Alexandrium_andersonii.AAC.1